MQHKIYFLGGEKQHDRIENPYCDETMAWGWHQITDNFTIMWFIYVIIKHNNVLPWYKYSKKSSHVI